MRHLGSPVQLHVRYHQPEAIRLLNYWSMCTKYNSVALPNGSGKSISLDSERGCLQTAWLSVKFRKNSGTFFFFLIKWPPGSRWVMWCLHPGQWLQMMQIEPAPPLQKTVDFTQDELNTKKMRHNSCLRDEGSLEELYWVAWLESIDEECKDERFSRQAASLWSGVVVMHKNLQSCDEVLDEL